MSLCLGIIGCGQLSQMLAEAARRQGADVVFLCVDETPVVDGLGTVYQPDQLDEFLAVCSAITVERESIPDPILRRAAAEVGLFPCYEALVVLRQRHTQKAMLDSLLIPTSPWSAAEDASILRTAYPERFSGAAIRCKRILGGYDGGGQWRVSCEADIDTIPDGGYPLIAEQEIAIERELALVIARDVNGRSCCYPMTENAMRDGILIGSFVPANVPPELLEQAQAHAQRLVDAMSYVGVLAIEFFVSEGKLLVNEVAPRVHNTGHWTIGAVGADQFTQHVNLVLGQSAVEPVFTGAAAMVNLLDEALPAVMPGGSVRCLIQTYGKGVRKGRKLGHITLLGADVDRVREEAEAMIRELH